MALGRFFLADFMVLILTLPADTGRDLAPLYWQRSPSEQWARRGADLKQMRTSPDYLRRGMKLGVIGCHPADRWARAGHYYAGRTNPFWPLLYDSGILPEGYTDDERIIEFGIGLTDLVKRATLDSGELPREEIAEGRILPAQKLEEYAPRMVAFNGKQTYEKFAQRPCK